MAREALVEQIRLIVSAIINLKQRACTIFIIRAEGGEQIGLHTSGEPSFART